MVNSTFPDDLANSLIMHKESGDIKRVVRDDGENGLHISPPESPTAMKPITREEFRNDWELYQTVNDQLKEEGRPEKDQPFRGKYEEHRSVVKGLDLSSQTQMPTVDSRNGVDDMNEDRQKFGALSRDPFGGRAVPTPRGEGADEYVATEATDVTFSGQPVGGNEEPAELLEEDRTDDSAADEAEAPKGKSKT
jgi:hypothetical protein